MMQPLRKNPNEQEAPIRLKHLCEDVVSLTLLEWLQLVEYLSHFYTLFLNHLALLDVVF